MSSASSCPVRDAIASPPTAPVVCDGNKAHHADTAARWVRPERILLDLALRLARVPSDQVRAEIAGGLKTVAEWLRANACTLIEPPEPLEAAWLSRFRAALDTTPAGRGEDEFPWYCEALQRGDALVCERSVDACWRQHAEWAPAPGGTGISAAVPIRLGSQLLGALLFDLDARQSAPWSTERSAQLQDVAGVLAPALQRLHLEAQLEDARRFELLLRELSSLGAPGSAADLERAIAAGLRRLAGALRLDHLVFLDVGSGAGEPRVIGRTPGGADSSLWSLQERFPDLRDRLVRGEVLSFAPGVHRHTRSCSEPEASPTQEPSLLALPLPVGDAPRLALCTAFTAAQSSSVEGLIPRLELAGAILANAWARAQAPSSAPGAADLAPRHEKALPAVSVHSPQPPAPQHTFSGVIGQSDLLRQVLFKVDQVASTRATTLLLGETGTGKSLIARTIHQRSPRREHSLITVNCAALPAGLIEAELFGREKGAFTGAYRSQSGRFELAHRGTLLLDEVGDLPLELQPKLLRALQEGEFERVGGTRTLTVDVRVIAATNRDLEDDVRQGRFREDLYYRLSVFPITIPALRARRDDVPALVHHLVERLSLELGKPIERIPHVVMTALQAHTWPGNIRELENVLTRALIVTTDTTLRLADPLALPAPGVKASSARLDAIERSHICEILCRHGWLIEGPGGAASALGLNPSTLRGRMRKLKISRPEEPRVAPQSTRN